MAIIYHWHEDEQLWYIVDHTGEARTAEQFIRGTADWVYNNVVNDGPTQGLYYAVQSGEIFSTNYENMFSAAKQIVTSKDKNDNIIKTPAMLESWVRINLDYAQSFVYMWVYRNQLKQFKLTPPEDSSIEDAADRAAKDKLIEFAKFIADDEKYFGDLTERKKKRKK